MTERRGDTAAPLLPLAAPPNRLPARGSDLWSPEDDQPFTLDDEPLSPASPSHHADLSRDSSFGRVPYASSNGYSAVSQNDFESAHVNHTFSPSERQRLNLTESIDYLPPNSKVYRQWLRGQPHRRVWDRWFMMASIGVTIGLTGYLLFKLIGVFSSIKFKAMYWLVSHAGLFVAWMFNISFSLLLVGVATWTVVEIAPAAAGAGVAEVMAYLNGCHVPKIFNVKTLLVKFISCACSVGSGLPVGPEGPMIHIGALIGSALSQGHSTTLNFSTGLFTRFQNPKDQRDFVTAGAAIGVAVAFSAPIGGLLFAFEEVASFFSTSLGWLIFFGCMISVLVLNTIRSAEALFSGGQFGLFDGDASTVFYEVQTVISNHVVSIVPAAAIGLVCGGLSIVFTLLNLKVSRLRQKYIGVDRQRRMLEPLLFTVLFITAGMMLPLLFSCRTPDCVNQQGIIEPVCANGTSADIGITAERGLEHWTCGTVRGQGPIQPYNPLAVLMDVPGEDAIRHLLSRGTHREFGYGPLVFMLIFYFCGAAVIAGSALSTGLFVPMLLIGCLIGRMMGLIALDIAAAHEGSGSTGIFLPPSPWAWIDPGVFALFGAGAFMGGVTRLTLALAVIMMEMSNDVRMLLPVLIAIMVAKWVADAATHSLYHGQLHVKAIPYLPEEPIARISLDLLPVSHLMKSPVVTFQEKMRLKDLRWALRNTTHNGFPVVRNTNHGQVFVGLVVRDHLMVLLRQALGRGSVDNEALSYSDLNRRYVSSAAQRIISEQQMAVLQASGDADQAEDSDSASEGILDLRPYINTSAITVDEGFSAERTYILLRTLGLRHVTVVDRLNRVKGMVTRKDLLGYKLDAAVDAAAHSEMEGSGLLSPAGLRSPTPEPQEEAYQ